MSKTERTRKTALKWWKIKNLLKGKKQGKTFNSENKTMEIKSSLHNLVVMSASSRKIDSYFFAQNNIHETFYILSFITAVFLAPSPLAAQTNEHTQKKVNH